MLCTAYEGHGLLLENLLEYDTDDWLKTDKQAIAFKRARVSTNQCLWCVVRWYLIVEISGND